MKAEKILDQIKAIFSTTELEEVMTAEGATLFADMFEVGEAVFIVQEDERIALPVGEYILEDGRTLVVTEEGIIGELKTVESEEEAEEEVVEEEMQEETLSREDVAEMIKSAISEAIEGLNLESVVNEKVNSAKEDLSKQVQELYENEPAEDAPKPNPEGQKRPRTGVNAVLNRLYNNY